MLQNFVTDILAWQREATLSGSFLLISRSASGCDKYHNGVVTIITKANLPVVASERSGGAAHSMRASAQVTAPGAITSMIVAVSTRPNRQNKSTCSRMSLSTKAEVEAGKPDRSTGSAEPSPMSWPLGWSTPPRRQMRTSWWFWPCPPPGYVAGTSTRPSTKSAGLLEGRIGRDV